MRGLLVLVAALGLCACGASERDRRPTVVASVYPLEWAARRIGGADVRVVNLTPAGAEPHDLELAPHDVEAIRDADLVVYAGGGFQPAVEDAVAERRGTSLDVADGAADPHVWLDPVGLERIATQIGTALGRPDAAARLAVELEALDDEFTDGLARCERRVLVTSHAAFGRLAARYGLTELALAGRTPESEPSPRELERLVRKVRASGATHVFAEPLVSDRVATTVAREVGADVTVLDPVEGLTQEQVEDGEDYLSVMRANLDALQEALGCR